jgi:riboflavin transporter FmnP
MLKLKGDLVMVNKLTTFNIVKIAFMGAISSLLMIIDMPLTIFPSFLKLDISDIPSIIGGLSMGPLAASLIELIKIILRLFFKPTDTMYVGEFANLIIGISLVVPISIIYNINKKRLQAYILGSLISIFCMTLVASILNLYILLPIYINIYFGGDVSLLLDLSMVTSLVAVIIYVIIPFNLIKGFLVVVLSYFIKGHLDKVIVGK